MAAAGGRGLFWRRSIATYEAVLMRMPEGEYRGRFAIRRAGCAYHPAPALAATESSRHDRTGPSAGRH
jgi:hypothetical protein